MLKIMIVDDEAIVRRCLKDTIDWAKYDCSVVAEATNGKEALEIFEKTQPDIILTDIVMNKKNGLEMIKSLREKKSDVGIIIITGYKNFDFAKTALENNVCAYILKPFSNEDVIREILKFKEKLQEKELKPSGIEQNLKKNGDFLMALLNEDNLTRKKCTEIAERFHFFLSSDIYCISVVQMDNDSENTNRYEISRYATLKESVTYSISTSVYYSILCERESNTLLMITFLGEMRDKISVDTFFAELQQHYHNASGMTITIGVSGFFNNLSLIKRAIRQAEAAVARRVILGRNQIIQYTEQITPDKSFAVLSPAVIDEIVSDIKNLDTQKAIATISVWLDKAAQQPQIDIELIKNSLLELTVLILRTIVQNTPSMLNIFGRTVLPAVELQKIEFIEDLKKWITELILCIEQHPIACTPYTYSPLVQKIMLYIRENYSAKISLESAANNLYISSRTLTRALKKETGKTFSQYLTEYRIEIAISLLKNETYRTFEIANMVGYPNTKNFHKIFKRITGHSPNFYRKNTVADE